MLGKIGDLLKCGDICYNGSNPGGGMIFLNNHVLGISWHVSVETAHKILPTLYILQGKTSPLGDTF